MFVPTVLRILIGNTKCCLCLLDYIHIGFEIACCGLRCERLILFSHHQQYR